MRFCYCAVFYLLFCFCWQANAQLSDSLYKALPDTLRPKNKVAITDQERINILLNIPRSVVMQYPSDCRAINHQLEKSMANQKDAAHKIPYADAIANFYMLTGDDAGSLFWNKKIVQFGQIDTSHPAIVSNAYNNLALYYSTIGQQDVAIDLLHQAQDLALKSKNAYVLSGIYLSYSNIYGHLFLNRQALTYINKYLTESPVRNRWDDDYTNQYVIKARIYSSLFQNEGKRMYADSARRLIGEIMATKKEQATFWYPFCYHALGLLAYHSKNYQEAIHYFDLLLLDKYKTSLVLTDRPYRPLLYKNASLVMMGRSEGLAPLRSIHPNPRDFYSYKALHDALYQYYRAKGNYRQALDQYTQYRVWSDSIDLAGQRGKVFEAQQKYSVAQKETAIAQLKTKDLQAQTTRNAIVVMAVIIILLLSILALMLYIRNKRQQVQRLAERQKLADELQVMEQEMELERLNQQAEQALAIATQRKAISQNMHDEVSSSLVALRYRVADIKRTTPIEAIREILDDIEDELNAVYRQTRDLLHRLANKNDQKTYNVFELLDNLSQRFDAGSGLQVHVEADRQLQEKLTPEQNAELYRIVKEAVANSMKHSGANRVDVTLRSKENALIFSIQDNGRGISSIANSGLGLATMQQRLQNLQGSLQIEPSVEGMHISGEFPISNA